MNILALFLELVAKNSFLAALQNGLKAIGLMELIRLNDKLSIPINRDDCRAEQSRLSAKSPDFKPHKAND